MQRWGRDCTVHIYNQEQQSFQYIHTQPDIRTVQEHIASLCCI